MTADNIPLISPVKNTWCPGCGNFSIQHAVKAVIEELINEGTPRENFVLVSGIGCHAKIVDYFNLNSFYTLHGRTIPVASGIKFANPNLQVICFAGDGDLYAEGLDHLIHAAKRNIDLTVICHNNRVYGLTTGQYTPTSPYGYKGKSTPSGVIEYPLNVIEVLLGSGATFVARAYTKKLPQLKRIIKEAILHKGFSHIDVLQICASFFNASSFYDEQVYETTEANVTQFDTACRTGQQWNYSDKGPIPLGIFFRAVKPSLPQIKESLSINRRDALNKIIKERMV